MVAVHAALKAPSVALLSLSFAAVLLVRRLPSLSRDGEERGIKMLWPTGRPSDQSFSLLHAENLS
jgi:hypothetical protein